MGKIYRVSDGTLNLILAEAEEGGFNVTSPDDAQLITQAETLQEAFAMAYDAARCLAEVRTLMADRARPGDAPASSVRESGAEEPATVSPAVGVRTAAGRPDRG